MASGSMIHMRARGLTTGEQYVRESILVMTRRCTLCGNMLHEVLIYGIEVLEHELQPNQEPELFGQ